MVRYFDLCTKVKIEGKYSIQCFCQGYTKPINMEEFVPKAHSKNVMGTKGIVYNCPVCYHKILLNIQLAGE